MKRVLSSYRKELQKLMDAANVPMGKQSRIDDLLTDIARAAGVQPADIHLCGEFDEDGELKRTFVGVWDPTPGADRELREFTEITGGEWQPPNSIRM